MSYNFAGAKLPEIYERLKMNLNIRAILNFQRHKRNQSAEEVCGKTGIPEHLYRGYEAGNATPGLEELIVLSLYYKLSLDEFLMVENQLFPVYPKEQQKAVAAAVLKLRQDNGQTRREMAADSGISIHIIEKVERAMYFNLNERVLGPIAAYYNVPIDSLIHNTDLSPLHNRPRKKRSDSFAEYMNKTEGDEG